MTKKLFIGILDLVIGAYLEFGTYQQVGDLMLASLRKRREA